ncbi:cell envelope integrity EipB family protein [Chenggangzhangella methanolivorans]|uniref:cell envelope integrity EipB family protein n=1 Tax=Chenggangzhangella methanolivorans TaxID=1437009 RepID=UPI0021BDAB35|nr:cell envelope integrity EipB family protein [Chenggangzhangella methanolivorans]
MVYQFTGDSCAGYALNFRQVTEIGNGEGQTNVSDLRSETWEDGAAKSFKFQAKNYLNDELDRDTDGRADRASDAVKVRVSKPTSVTKDYDVKTLFPTEHLLKILDAARTEKTLLEAAVYDGSEAGDKIYDTLSVVGKAETAPPAEMEAAAKRPELEKQRFWPVSISYFERGKKTDGEQTPDYQMSFDLYENGVSRSLKIDYGEFVISGDLVELDLMTPSACKK